MKATEAELRDLCDHRCIQPRDHDGRPHFHGYTIGPWSITGMEANIDRLRDALEDLLDWAKRHHAGDPNLHREEFWRTTEHAANVLADTSSYRSDVEVSA